MIRVKLPIQSSALFIGGLIFYCNPVMFYSKLLTYLLILSCAALALAENSVINYRDGGSFVGEVVNNRRHGFGEMKYSTGDVYTGQWKDDVINGRGRIVYANGNWYDGDWVNGKHHGGGTKMWSGAGSKYSGEWFADKIQGQGWYRYPSGDLYEGLWWNNMRHGRGELRDGQGKVIETGVWELNVRKYD